MSVINKVRAKPRPKPKVDKPVDIMSQFETAFNTLKIADQSPVTETGNALYTKAIAELDEVLQKNGGKDNKVMHIHVMVAKLKVYRNWLARLSWATTTKKRSFQDNLISENVQPLADELAPLTVGKRGLYVVVRALCRQIDVRFPSQPYKASPDEVLSP